MKTKNNVKKLWIVVIAIFAVAAIVAGSILIPAVRNTIFGEWVVTIQPTCETEGERQRTNCFNKTKIETIAALGHDFDITVVNQDCINDGYSTYDCKRCDVLYDADFVRANGHNYDEWEVVRAATCTSNGLKKQTCKTCETTNMQIIYSVGHEYKPVAETLDNATEAKYICAVCNDAIVQESEEQIPVNIGDNYLFDVPLDFSFDIVTSENEEYIRENLVIIFAGLENTAYEGTVDSIVQYNLMHKGNNVWSVSPVSDYEYFTTYKARLSGNIKLADYHSDNIVFKTIVDENHEDICEYNENIVFLAKLEANSPGYYPYNVVKTNNGEFIYLHVNKSDALYVGNILCVGDVESIEDIYSSTDYFFGKIKSIQPMQNGEWLVVLQSPTLGEVFSALDMASSGDVVISEDAFDKDAVGAELINALYSDEDFYKFLGTVNVAATSYAKENGYETASIKNMASFWDYLSFDGTDVKLNDAKNGLVGIIKGNLKIPLKDKNKREIGEFKVSFTVNTECSFAIDKNIDINYLNLSLDYLDLNITQTTVFGFEFSVEIDIDYKLKDDAYLQNKNSGKIHRRGCSHLTTSANPQNYKELSIKEAEKLINKTPSLACKQCKPVEDFVDHLLVININKNHKIIHMYNCMYVGMMSEENKQVSDENATYWMEQGYTCCDYCHPDNRKALDFNDVMVEALGHTDWSQTVTDIAQYAKDAGISEEVSSSKTLIKIPIDVFFPLRIYINVNFDFAFELEASASYKYAVKNVTVVGITYNSYFVDTYCRQGENTVTKNEFSLIGKAKVKAGFGVDAGISICGLEPWVNAQIGAGVGAYAELSGVLQQDFLSNEDYAAAYLELGLYLDVDCSYKLFKFGGEYTIYEKEWPLFMYGYEKAYFAFDSVVEEISVDDIYDYSSLLKVKYYDLTDMKQLTETLSVNGVSGKYSVNVSLKNGEYFEIKGTTVVEKDNIPCNATDTLVISVIGNNPNWTKYNESKYIYYLNDYEITILPAVKVHNYVNGVCTYCELNSADDENHRCSTEWKTTLEPTCSRHGEKQLLCVDCGRIVTIQQIQKLTHTYSEWKVDIEATEEKDGSRSRYCTLCGLKETSVIPKLEHTHKYLDKWVTNKTDHWKECKCGEKSNISAHDYGDWIITTEATEETEGRKHHVCKTCDYKETVSIPMLEHTHKYSDKWSNNETDHWKECKCGEKSGISSHNYGNWTITKEATCTTAGIKKHTCTTCGYSETTSIPIIAHTYGDWKSNATSHWKECECGNKKYAANHVYGNWTTTKEATCTSSGTKKHTCTACGYSETETLPKLDHAYGGWKSNGTSHWKECTACGNKADASNHVYGNWTTTKGATCTSSGTKKHTCTTCGYSETASIPMKDHAYGSWKSTNVSHWKECTSCGNKADTSSHIYGNWTITKEATEETEGSKYHTCTACGYKETVVIPVLEHTHKYSDTWSIDKTNHWKECKCGEKSGLTKHIYGSWTTIKEATCTSSGTKKHTCTTCGYSETTSIPIIAHTYGGWTSNGTSHWKECKCGDKEYTANHTYGEWTVTKDATCTATGTKKHTCTTCGYSETASIPMIAHTYGGWKSNGTSHWKECTACGNKADTSNHVCGDWTVVTPQTCAKEGAKERTCTICRYIETGVIPKSTHTYADWGYSKDSHWKVCSKCGNKSVSSDHNYARPGEVVTQATCKQIGTEKLTCSDCGHTVIVETGYGNHVYSSVVTPPTVIDQGYTTFTCSECGYSYVDEYVDAIGYSEGLAYKVNSNGATCTITGIGTCTDTYLRIPDTIENYVVTDISDYAFQNCTNLTRVYVGSNVKFIGEHAFQGCAGITELVVPFNITWSGIENCTITVNRISSLFAHASIGIIENDDTVYYGDVLEITYTAETGYHILSTNTSKITVTGNVTSNAFYADVEINTYTIVFDANGGSGSMPPMEGLKFNQLYSLSSNNYTPQKGWKFAGWNTKRDGSGLALSNGAKVSHLRTGHNETVVLYAQWELITSSSATYGSIKADSLLNSATGYVIYWGDDFDFEYLASHGYKMNVTVSFDIGHIAGECKYHFTVAIGTGYNDWGLINSVDKYNSSAKTVSGSMPGQTYQISFSVEELKSRPYMHVYFGADGMGWWDALNNSYYANNNKVVISFSK